MHNKIFGGLLFDIISI